MSDNTAKPGKPAGQVGTRGLGHSIFDTALTSLALMVVTLLTGIFLSRILGPDGRGVYGAAVFWAKLAPSLLTFSIFEASVIRLRSKGGDTAHFLPSLLVTSAALTLLALVISLVLVLTGLITVEGLSDSDLLLFCGCYTILGIFECSFQCTETSRLRFTMVNVERVVSPGLYLLGVIVLWLMESEGVRIFLIALLVTKTPLLLVRIYRFRHELIGPVDTAEIGKNVKLGWKLNLSRATATLAMEADRLVLVSLWSNQMLGLYFVALSTCGAALGLGSAAIQITLLPSLSGLSREEKREKIEKLLRLSALIGVGLVAGLWVTAPFLIPLVFGEEFRPAAAYVQGLVFASVLMPMIGIINIANYSEERTLPGIYMSLAFIAVLALGFLITGFKLPVQFFVTYGLANFASIATGLAHLHRQGLVRIGMPLVPGPSDAMFLVSAFWRYGRSMIGRKA